MESLPKMISKLPKSWIVILFGLVLFLPFLGTFELTAITEGVYSGVAREMAGRHDWISPFFNQQFWADKPPLHLWILAVSGWLGGWSEFALRIPGVLFTLGTGWLVFWMGKKLFSEKIGFLGALIFFTSLETIVAAQIILVDMTFTFFIVLAMSCFLNFFYHERKSRFIYGFFAACAGAVMTKGLIGLIIPLGGGIIYIIWNKEWRVFTRRALDILAGFGLFFLIAAPWYVIEIQRHGAEFIQKFFIYFNVQRFTQGVDNANPWYYYFLIVLIGLFPWSSFLARPFISLRQIPDKIFTRTIISLSVFTFVFFSLSVTKLHTYLLPLFPFWSLLLAHGWESFWAQTSKSIWRFFSGVLIIFPLISLFLIWAGFRVSENHIGGILIPSLVIIIVPFVIILAGAWKKFSSPNFYFGLLVCLVLAFNLNVKGYIMPYLQKNYLYLRDFATVINAEYKPGDKIGVICTAKDTASNLPFYTQKKVDSDISDPNGFLAQSARVFLIIPENQVQAGAMVLAHKAGWALVSNQ